MAVHQCWVKQEVSAGFLCRFGKGRWTPGVRLNGRLFDSTSSVHFKLKYAKRALFTHGCRVPGKATLPYLRADDKRLAWFIRLRLLLSI